VLRLYRELLPDREAILGSRHPDTLTTRHNLAYRADECGDSATALRLYKELLLDVDIVLGPRHPFTLTTCHASLSWRRFSR